MYKNIESKAENQNTIVVSKRENFVCKDEIYCNWYECDNCGIHLRSVDKFCSECGSKLKWIE